MMRVPTMDIRKPVRRKLLKDSSRWRNRHHYEQISMDLNAPQFTLYCPNCESIDDTISKHRFFHLEWTAVVSHCCNEEIKIEEWIIYD